ncbi:MAG: HAMP domain-containing histidine kinase [Actinobacteria bacterium]|nr:HAMP domain-containing histidine kinase [Actinomycetota bacterium]
MRTRLIIAFIVVVVLAAIPEAWLISLVFHWYPSLAKLAVMPGPLSGLLVAQRPCTSGPPGCIVNGPDSFAVAAFFLTASGLVLAVITGLAFAASRRVLRPVGRLARAAHRMSGGDLSVRVEPSGRDELAQLVTSFNTMAATLEDKVSELQRMEARARQFAGDVSHELRTPLTTMTAVADILPGHPGLTGDAAAAARLVRQEIFHLNRLVEDLIEISRFDAGTAQLVTDDTDVATAVSGCLRARGWTDVSAGVPAGLIARLDRRRFDVIIANLVGNALRHGGPPVTVTARAGPHGSGEGRLVLEVRDHGAGLPEAAIPHLFDRFFKADTARARSEGSGLGLAIAWENAQLHGGHIEAANHPDGGAVFTASLPLNRDLAATGTVPRPVPAGL